MSPKPYWFKAKHYGWGWYPVTWQGWVITLLFVQSFAVTAPNPELMPLTIILVAALLIICYNTGEKPSWRWGDKPIKKN
jgi:hypothetical protein